MKQTYVELLLARAMLSLYEQQAPILRDIADAATLRFASGHAGQHDTVKSVVELARLQVDSIEWHERTRIAEARLATLLGRDPGSPLPALAAADSGIPDMVVYLHEALDRRLATGGTLTAADILQATIDGSVLRLRPKLMTVSVVMQENVPIQPHRRRSSPCWLRRTARAVRRSSFAATVLAETR